MRRSFLLFLLLVPALLRGEHFSGARITYECVSNNVFRIHLDIFLDCAGEPMVPQTLNFASNCGTTFSLANLLPVQVTEISPVCDAQLPNTTCNGGTLPGFRLYRFTVQQYLSPCNSWSIQWNNCCRNTMVNVQNYPGMYVTATINTHANPCDSSPVFTTGGVPFGCVNIPVNYNAGVVDPNGNSMTYALISARFGSATTSSPVTYFAGYSGAQPIPGITLDPITGQLSFTATVAGYYTVVLEVLTRNANNAIIGRVMWDMMFVIRACGVTSPVFNGLTSISHGSILDQDEFVVCPNTAFCVNMSFSDNSPFAQMSINTNADLLLPGSTTTATGGSSATGSLCWTVPAMPPLSSVLLNMELNNGVCPIPGTTSFQITANFCNPLPLELLDFQATPLAGQVLLKWSTGSEWDLQGFEVERSLDGAEFRRLAEVPAAGGQYQLTEYAFIDEQPGSGLVYYRLREVDLDGTDRPGRVVAVWVMAEKELLIRPDGRGGWEALGAPPNAGWSIVDARGGLYTKGNANEHGVIPIGQVPFTGVMVLMIQDADGLKGVRLPMMMDGVR
jgi:hypothetical protein